MKKFVSIIISLLLAFMLVNITLAEKEPITAVISIKDLGDIKLELYEDKAPQTVRNFVALAKSGFYNNLVFHRIISGFMIQGGSPDGFGMGGPGYNIYGEFADNGFDNGISHVRGTISMARAKQYDSAGSQFFIVHQDSTFLDGQYAAFGKVIEGMDIVDEIAEMTKDQSDRPLEPPVISSVSIYPENLEIEAPEKIKK